MPHFAQLRPSGPNFCSGAERTGCALFVLGIAGAAYGAYWVKNRAMAKYASYSGGAVGGSGGQVKVAQGHACTLMSREDLQQALGVTIERTAEIIESEEPGCAYYTNPAAFAQLQRMAVEQAKKDSEVAAQQPAPKTDNPLELLKDVNKLEGVVKTLTMRQPDKEGRVFSFTIERAFGRKNWPTMRATMSVVPGFEVVPGVGDAAMVGSFGHVLHVLKGDSMIKLDLTSVPDARVRGAELGRKILSHL